jgi:class 3 adenylate cyclase
MREIIGVYHRCCAETISTAGGFVAKYMVDGVLAYFGYIPMKAVVSDHREPGRLK